MLCATSGECAVWSVVRVPTVEEEDARQLHRELRTWKQEAAGGRSDEGCSEPGLWLPAGPTSGAARGCAVGRARRALAGAVGGEWEPRNSGAQADLSCTRTPARDCPGRGEASTKSGSCFACARWVQPARGLCERVLRVRRFRNRKEVGRRRGSRRRRTRVATGAGKGISKAGSRQSGRSPSSCWGWLRYQRAAA